MLSVEKVLGPMGQSPKSFLVNTPDADIKKLYKNFVHRFADGEKLSSMLIAMKGVIREYGGLYQCFLAGDKPENETILPGLTHFVSALLNHAPHDPGHLIPRPEKKSACKRLLLFMRWMVRKDAVDPGGWDRVSPSRLIIPLDVHMHRISLNLNLTCAKQAQMACALEVTGAFRKISPHDPVKYDFTLTRPGIRGGIHIEGFPE